MPSNDELRSFITEALDDLGERDRMSYAQRTAGDVPYPPEIVEERVASIQRSRRIIRGLLVVVAVLVTGFLLTADYEWGIAHSVVSSVLLPLIPPIGFGVYWLSQSGKAEQLYLVLQYLDQSAKSAHE